MKIVTGLLYRRLTVQRLPLIQREAVSFERGAGLLPPTVVPHVSQELHPVSLHDPKTEAAMTVVYFSKEPTVISRQLKLRVIEGMNETFIQHSLEREGVPDDARKEVKLIHGEEVTEITWEWIEISA